MIIPVISRIWNRMKERVRQKMEQHQPGLYVELLFPIMFTFVITFTISRLLAYFAPGVYLETSSGLHIHHFTYGIFLLAIAGYLGLVFNGPQAKFYIACLFGVGLGLSFDEFGMWLRLSEDDVIRLEYDGFNVIIGLVILIAVFKPGLRFIRKLWPW